MPHFTILFSDGCWPNSPHRQVSTFRLRVKVKEYEKAHLGHKTWWTNNYLIAGFLGWGELWIVVSSKSHRVSSPAVVNFQLPKWCHWMRSWEEMYYWFLGTNPSSTALATDPSHVVQSDFTSNKADTGNYTDNHFSLIRFANMQKLANILCLWGCVPNCCFECKIAWTHVEGTLTISMRNT